MKIPLLVRPNYTALIVARLGAFFSVANLLCAQSWQQTAAPDIHVVAVAASADFATLIAAGISGDDGCGCNLGAPSYLSTDSGASWVQSSSPGNAWKAVASSASGTKLVGAGGFILGPDYPNSIYTSLDSGATWSVTSAPTNFWTSVASSADGTQLAAVAVLRGIPPSGWIGDGLIYTSTNAGVTWRQTSAPSNNWFSVATSADGTKMVAVAYLDPSGDLGSIYASIDSGATWSKTSAPSNNWTSIASSADGTRLAAAASYNSGAGFIYVSTNAGFTWAQTSAPQNSWASVACSSEGNILLAADDGGGDGGIYTSRDFGATWTNAVYDEGGWTSVACSSDGNKQLAASFVTGTIWQSRAPSSSSIKIEKVGTSCCISWLVPSSPAVLQQNSDLNTTNWRDVLAPTALNFTNLNYQMTVSPVSGGKFYRLKQQ